jgi:hypothetical protein
MNIRLDFAVLFLALVAHAHLLCLLRPEVVGWGFTDGDPYSQFENSNFAKGGTSAAQRQQVLDIPVLSAAEVIYLSSNLRYSEAESPGHTVPVFSAAEVNLRCSEATSPRNTCPQCRRGDIFIQ